MKTVNKRDDKHIEIDGIINIDFIHEKNELHEIKEEQEYRRGWNMAG